MGGGAPWWVHSYEKNFYESCLFVILVCGAVFFELIFHNATHWTEHSYAYGSSRDHHHAAEDRHSRHKQLFHELALRIGSEFMTLGFLACCIFVLNITGVFNMVADSLTRDAIVEPWPEDPSASSGGSQGSAAACPRNLLVGIGGMAMPQTGGDWLYLAEEVHIRMFFGMIIYFCIITSVVRATIRHVQELEELTNRKLLMDSKQTTAALTFDSQLRHYCELHEYFIKHTLRLQSLDELRFERILSVLWNDGEEPSDESDFADQTRERLEKELSVSQYLALSLERGVGHIVEVHMVTWFLLIIAFGVFMVLNLLGVEMIYIAPFILLFAAIALAAGLWHIKRKDKFIEKSVHDSHMRRTSTMESITGAKLAAGLEAVQRKTSELSAQARKVMTNADRGIMSEFFILRSIEATLFIWCESFASILIDKWAWSEHFVENLIQCMFYTICTGVALTFLPKVVVLTLKHTALPPGFSTTHFDVLLRVLQNPDPAEYDLIRAGFASESASQSRSPSKRLHCSLSPRKSASKSLGPCPPEQPRAWTCPPGIPEGLSAALGAVVDTPEGRVFLDGLAQEVARRTREMAAGTTKLRDAPATGAGTSTDV